jgi:hypothetical protein
MADGASFPPSWDRLPDKKDMNLRVLKRIFSPAVLDYSLSIPAVSVCQHSNGQWHKLKINGPLFVLSLADSRCPVLFVMATTNFQSVQNFNISVPFGSAQAFVSGPQFHLKVGDRPLMFSTHSDADAAKLERAIATFSPGRVSAGDKTQPAEVTRDPTYRHLLRMLKRP